MLNLQLSTLEALGLITVVMALLLLSLRLSRQQRNGDTRTLWTTPEQVPDAQSDALTSPGAINSCLESYKELFHKLHNLEQHPDVLLEARETLVTLFSSAIQFKQNGPKKGIFEFDQYRPGALGEVLSGQQNETFQQWETYIGRRKNGASRALFSTRDDALQWLKQVAPLKYVDGAWLGHLSRSTMPFYLRDVVKNAWQILSEEYGDGELEKHHVHVFRTLLDSLNVELPAPDTREFLDPKHRLVDTGVWRAAVAQLLISLFPNDFLPEILGFNLHYESVKLQTLIAARELRELRIDPYYFVLHVSIDNGDTGHAAIALYAAQQYLERVSHLSGDAKQEETQAWRRMQTGFALSEYLEADTDPMATYSWRQNEGHTKSISSIIHAKCLVSGGLHCNSGVRIGGKKLSDWLHPQAMSSYKHRMEFIDGLGASPWVIKGVSANSRLVKEICWGGRMFGVFTNSEVRTIKNWIDSLNDETRLYWIFTGRSRDAVIHATAGRCITTRYPGFVPLRIDDPPEVSDADDDLLIQAMAWSDLGPLSVLSVEKLLPLWFSHTCLLQSLVTVPFRSATPARCAILRVLRAQAGFDVEESWVAGLDEARRQEVIGIVDLGLQIMENAGLETPQTLGEVLERWPCEFAETMMHLSIHPEQEAGVLIGLAWAFVDLHDGVAKMNLVTQESCSILAGIAARERDFLCKCVEALGSEPPNRSMTKRRIRGAYIWGKKRILAQFQSV